MSRGAVSEGDDVSEVNIPDFLALRSAVESRNRIETWKTLRKISYKISFNKYEELTIGDIYHILSTLDDASTVFTRPEDVTLLNDINTVLATISKWFELYRENVWTSCIGGDNQNHNFEKAAKTYNYVLKKLGELPKKISMVKERAQGGWFLAS